MARRRKKSELNHIGDVLQSTFKRKKLRVSVKDQHISESWKKAVGPIIAAQTMAQNLRGDTLFVKVSNSNWMQQLQFMKQEILNKVNAVLPDKTISNIYFSIGQIPSPLHKSQSEAPPDLTQYPLRTRDLKIIEESTESISDEELRDILKRVMTKEIINRRIRQG
jgi:hypothetical protein